MGKGSIGPPYFRQEHYGRDITAGRSIESSEGRVPFVDLLNHTGIPIAKKALYNGWALV